MKQRTTRTPAAFPWGERIRWSLFRLAEVVSLLRSQEGVETPPPPDSQSAKGSLWLFASTIGELNAISTLIQRLLRYRTELQLVLISDHEHYRDSYIAKYPSAVFFYTKGASKSARLLRQKHPPRLFIIGEIPCIPSDAPCRLSYAYVREAKKAGALTVLANGWLYGESPGSRIDQLERQLLTRDYLAAIDVVCVQTREIRETLIGCGIEPKKVHVTGSMKFDSLKERPWTVHSSGSPKLFQAIIDSLRPVIVIGCMHHPEQQTLIIETFASILKQFPTTLMVFAHRHPEVKQNLDKLAAELEANQIAYSYRSRIGDAAPPKNTQCLILDTIGELKHFYAVASTAYVGPDHNLLEPLTFGTPVTTGSIWHKELPNYSIYSLLSSSGAVVVADNKEQLGTEWAKQLKDPRSESRNKTTIDAILVSAAGATEETCILMGIDS